MAFDGLLHFHLLVLLKHFSNCLVRNVAGKCSVRGVFLHCIIQLWAAQSSSVAIHKTKAVSACSAKKFRWNIKQDVINFVPKRIKIKVTLTKTKSNNFTNIHRIESRRPSIDSPRSDLSIYGLLCPSFHIPTSVLGAKVASDFYRV